MDILNYKDFLDKLMNEIVSRGIDVSNLEMDHLGYRVSSLEEYEKLTPEFMKLGEKVHENDVRGRMVSIYKLNEPWVYMNYRISAVELIGPKEGEELVAGYEYAEFVLKEDFKSFMKKYSEVDWDITTMKVPDFPMIKLKLNDSMRAKFHMENVLAMVNKMKEKKT
jgi:predicted metalloenzyme YecM